MHLCVHTCGHYVMYMYMQVHVLCACTMMTYVSIFSALRLRRDSDNTRKMGQSGGPRYNGSRLYIRTYSSVLQSLCGHSVLFYTEEKSYSLQTEHCPKITFKEVTKKKSIFYKVENLIFYTWCFKTYPYVDFICSHVHSSDVVLTQSHKLKVTMLV